MTSPTIWRCAGGAAALLLAGIAQAQPYDLSWHTIDGGGGESAGGTYVLTGTVGQPDAAGAGGGFYTLASGFWAAFVPDPCYANCDASTVAPVLNINDFQCFVNKFAAADQYANCDGSTVSPALNINDFQCFVNKYAAGCT